MDRARGNSAWFWLCSGKLEVVCLLGLFSLLAQFLYWSEIVGELNEQQAERLAACSRVHFGKLHPPKRIIRAPDDMARMPRKPSSTGWHCQKTRATSSLTIRQGADLGPLISRVNCGGRNFTL